MLPSVLFLYPPPPKKQKTLSVFYIFRGYRNVTLENSFKCLNDGRVESSEFMLNVTMILKHCTTLAYSTLKPSFQISFVSA